MDLELKSPDGTLHRFKLESGRDQTFDLTLDDETLSGSWLRSGPNSLSLLTEDGKSHLVHLARDEAGQLHVQHEGLKFATDRFTLNRGEKIVLSVRLVDGEVRVMHDERVIARRQLDGEGAPSDLERRAAAVFLFAQEPISDHLAYHQTAVRLLRGTGYGQSLFPPGMPFWHVS